MPATALNLFVSHSYRHLNHASQSLPPHHLHDWASYTHPCAEGLATSSRDGSECCRCLIPSLSSGMWVPLMSLLYQDFSIPRSSTAREGLQLSSHAPRDPHSTVFSRTHHSQGHCHQNHHGFPVPWRDTSPSVLSCVHLPGHHPLSPGCTPDTTVPSPQAVPRVPSSPTVGSECAKSWGEGVIVALSKPQ